MKHCIWNIVIQRAVTVVLAATAYGLVIDSVRGALVRGKPTDIKDPRVFDSLLVAKLSSDINAWSQLISDEEPAWHDSAVHRFFVAGPLDDAQIKILADTAHDYMYRGHPARIWQSGRITNVNTSVSDLIQKLQELATSEYKMSTSIPGNGFINTSMWTLLFWCPSASGCTDGYLVPIVVVPLAYPGASSPSISYYYASVWQQPTSTHPYNSIAINAIPASIKTKPEAIILGPGESTILNIHDVLSEPTVFNIHNLSICQPTISLVNHRSLLDSAYGLVPSMHCVIFTMNGKPFEILVVGLLDAYRVQRPFDQCSGAPVFAPVQETAAEDIKHFVMCHGYNGCIDIKVKDFDTTAVKAPSFDQFWSSMLYTLHDCQKVRSYENKWCDTSLSENMYTSFYHIHSTGGKLYNSFSWESRWAAESDASEFDNNSPHAKTYSACSQYMFAMKRSHGSDDKLIAPEVFTIRAREYLTSYISEHNTEFTTFKGPAIDPYTFYALLISTALSVITLATPFTNFILHAICHVHPSYVNPSSKYGAALAASRVFKPLIHVFCNVVLSLAFLLPVASLAKNELDRQNAFSTWDVKSNDFQYDGKNIQVVYLFSATSKYTSHFLLVIVVVICLTIVVVAACTARRCLQVFARYGLLLEKSLMMGNYQSHSSSEFKRALKAIEMGEAEYLDLQLQISDLEQSLNSRHRS